MLGKLRDKLYHYGILKMLLILWMWLSVLYLCLNDDLFYNKLFQILSLQWGNLLMVILTSQIKIKMQPKMLKK